MKSWKRSRNSLPQRNPWKNLTEVSVEEAEQEPVEELPEEDTVEELAEEPAYEPEEKNLRNRKQKSIYEQEPLQS